MKLVWYGTAALILSTVNTKIAFDPFGCIPLGAKRLESVPIAHADEFRAVHDVFVTHGHFDHIMHIPALYSDTDAVIRASETPVNTLKAHGFPAERLDHYDDSFPPLTKTVPVGPIETAARDQLGIPCGALNINETITL